MPSGESASMKRTLICLILPALLASCGTGPLVEGPPVQHRVPFNETDFAFARGTGTASVSGWICVDFTDRTTTPGSHIYVDLMPKTPYTAEIVNRKFIGRENLVPTGPRLDKYTRSTMTDGNGHFAFYHVPAGEYYINGVVDWKDTGEILDPDTNVPETATGWWTNHKWAWQHIKVADGQALRVKVTQ
jgi:hypothetical protein